MYNEKLTKDYYTLVLIKDFWDILFKLHLLQVWDKITLHHVLNTGYICGKFAEIMGWDPIMYCTIGVLHDMGKFKVMREILVKPGKPTHAEWGILKTHPAEGAKIIKEINMPEKFRELAIAAASYHHEKWDGSGYPFGLKGEKIPFVARVIAMVDVCEALLAKRPYKPTLSLDIVMGILKDGAGKHFDPDLMPPFLEVISGIIRT